MENPYHKFVLPRLTDWVCGSGNLIEQRLKIVPKAAGVVLEIGMGSGHNIPFYNPDKVKKLIGLEPSNESIKLARERIEMSLFEVQTIHGRSEKIELVDESVDCVLFTFTLCSIKNIEKSLEEIERVLRPGGAIYFCEHGLAPEKSIQHLQNTLNPFWKIISGGCNLNRDIPQIISSQFQITELETRYNSGLKFGSYHYCGCAQKTV